VEDKVVGGGGPGTGDQLARNVEASEQRRGPTLHDYVLRWVARHAGSGHDRVREQIREEYRRLLATFALSYFPADLRLADLDRRALQGFIGWLTDRPGRRGRLSDRSIRNALTPLRRCLDAAAGEGLIDGDLARSLVLPSRRGGRRWAVSERRFLTRVQLGRLLTEIPPAHQPLLVLLASTGLWISEGDRAARVRPGPRLEPTAAAGTKSNRSRYHWRPKSYYGARVIPLAEELAGRLRALRPPTQRTRTSYSPTAAGGRSTRITSEIASSRPPPSVPACPESVCTRYATPAPRC